MRPLRVNAAVLGAFAAFAVLLAALGVYGVLAYLVAQRTPEIGLRMALGATAANVSRLVLRSVMMMVVVGMVAGAVGSLAFTRVLRAMLVRTSPTDPTVFFAAVLAIAAAAPLAASFPPRRPARGDP